MKKKLIKIFTLCLVPALIVGLSGCKKEAGENSGYVLQDTEVYPAVTAPYETESKALISEYYAVANKHLDASGDIDLTNEEVQAEARDVAAKLYAYACYNEEYLDKYVYFSDQEGKTDLGSSGSSTATKQDYKLIIHDSTEVCGYKYHYTIKKVDQSSGLVSSFKSMFESSKLRFVEAGTNCLYRFNGSDVEYDDDGYLTCTWNIDTSQSGGWGASEGEPAIVKRGGDKLTLDGIEEDIVNIAAESPSSAVIHGNVNILADGMVKNAYIIQSETGDSYTIIMIIDTDVANADESSLAMLQEANSSSDCTWSDNKLTISYQIWNNGLMRSYQVSETWEGKISGFSGSVKSTTNVDYSYSDRIQI
ncbi:MAG: hypothetical protein LUI60_03430 [Clostridia bacterium]|nr:hypothetical protein [Clostridia bacterium]